MPDRENAPELTAPTVADDPNRLAGSHHESDEGRFGRLHTVLSGARVAADRSNHCVPSGRGKDVVKGFGASPTGEEAGNDEHRPPLSGGHTDAAPQCTPAQRPDLERAPRLEPHWTADHGGHTALGPRVAGPIRRLVRRFRRRVGQHRDRSSMVGADDRPTMPRMAELRFFFGTMGSGKSTMALQIRHNLTGRGLECLLITQLDREQGKVSSRLGVSAEAMILDHTVDLFRAVSVEHRRGPGLHAVICDEAQFYEPGQVDQLTRVVDHLDIDVYAFGLLTSFQGDLFPGTRRLLEVADVRQEIQVEARCWCGARATHNARLVNGRQVYDGELKVVGDTGRASDNDEPPPVVSYDLRCRKHWMAEKDDPRQDALFDDLPLVLD